MNLDFAFTWMVYLHSPLEELILRTCGAGRFPFPARSGAGRCSQVLLLSSPADLLDFSFLFPVTF